MEKMIIQGSTDKPTIRLDSVNGDIYIGGSSLPEDVREVFNPVIDWLHQYSEKPNNKTEVTFFFEYINSSSANMIARIVDILINLKRKTEINLTWSFYEGDDDTKEIGDDLLTDSGISYTISESIPVELF